MAQRPSFINPSATTFAQAVVTGTTYFFADSATSWSGTSGTTSNTLSIFSGGTNGSMWYGCSIINYWSAAVTVRFHIWDGTNMYMIGRAQGASGVGISTTSPTSNRPIETRGLSVTQLDVNGNPYVFIPPNNNLRISVDTNITTADRPIVITFEKVDL